MPRKFSPEEARHAVALHRQGIKADDIAARLGRNRKTVYASLKASGVALHGRRIELDTATITKMFDSGIGVRGIAEKLGTSPRPVERVLREAGIALRNRSEQQRARMQRASPRERKRLAQAANKAVRGTTPSEATMRRRATSREARQSCATAQESELARLLEAHGLACGQQTAVGRYNCDLTCNGVAVEVFGGEWHFSGAHAARSEERFRYIMQEGWHVVCVLVGRDSPLDAALANKVAREIKRLRRNKASVRQYRMIWSALQPATGGCLDDDQIAFVRPTINSRNPRTGRYESVPR